MDFGPFFVTFKLAFLTTFILFVIAVPIAYFIAFSKRKTTIIIESVLMLPIILPPTVLGFYYLSFLGAGSSIGQFFENVLGFSFTFSFNGLLIGSIIYCMPFMLSPLISGFRNIPKNLIESTYLLKKSRINAIWNVFLPNIKTSIWSALLLSFAHTIGEFGLVLMIGGNLKETKPASVAIYDEMNGLNYDLANQYAFGLLLISFVLIVAMNLLTRKNQTRIV